MADYTNTILNKYVNKETGSSQVTKGMKQIGESIKIPTYLLEQFKSKTVAATTAQRQLTNATKRITDMSHKYGVSANRVTSALESQRLKIDKTGKSLRNARGQTVSWDHAMGKMRQQMRPFKAHLLSLMFAGMALSKTFGGMVRQVMEMTGIFEVWRGTLAMILLPILMPFARVLMRVMFWLMKHKTVAKFVGWFIVFAAVLGAVVMFLGMAGLALEGLAAWAAGASLVAWFGKGGFWWVLRAAPVIALLIDLASNIKEGATIGVIADLFGLAAFLLPVPPHVKALFAVGAAVLFAAEALTGAGLGWKGFLSILGFLSYAGWQAGGPWGAVAGATIAVIFKIVVDWEDFKSSLKNALAWVKENPLISAIVGLATGVAGFFAGRGRYLPKGMKLGGAFGTMIMPDWLKWPGGLEGEFQAGGYVSRTGAYKLHAGETVIPAGGPFNTNIIVNANIQSDMDVKRLADRLSVEMGNTFERDYGRRAA